MRKSLCLLFGLLLASSMPGTHGASIFERLGFGRKTTNQTGTAASLANLSEDQVRSGLRQALSNGVATAIAQLGTTNGFLNNRLVKIPMPPALQKVERTLRTLRQDKMADDFILTLNRAAEKAVPEAATILTDAVSSMNLADAKNILTATNNAATEYFRRTSGTNLYMKFLPIIQNATSEAGVTALYKQMLDKTKATSFGGLGASLLGGQDLDLDSYVTQKSLDGLFLKIAEQEKLIRENPAARTTELLNKVFGSIQGSLPVKNTQ